MHYIIKTSRLFTKAVEISGSDEKFTRRKILGAPFTTPISVWNRTQNETNQTPTAQSSEFVADLGKIFTQPHTYPVPKTNIV